MEESFQDLAIQPVDFFFRGLRQQIMESGVAKILKKDQTAIPVPSVDGGKRHPSGKEMQTDKPGGPGLVKIRPLGCRRHHRQAQFFPLHPDTKKPATGAVTLYPPYIYKMEKSFHFFLGDKP